MTGETKIGLITGLSVIIVFAMILSHKGSGPNEITPPLRTPDVHSEYTDQAPPPSPSTLPEPTAPASAAEPLAAAGPAEPTPPGPADQPPPPAPFDSSDFVPVHTPRTADQHQPVLPEALRRRIEGRPATEEKPRQVTRPAPAPPADRHHQPLPPDQPERIYVAQANDNLTRIARRLLGSGSTENVNLIYELNRDRLPDKDSLQVGQRIRIPQGPAPSRPGPRRGADDRLHQTPARSYVVKPGDNYAAIARAELGNAKRWREVFELNQDRFPDPDLLPAGATIKLPGPTSVELRLASR